MGQLVTNWPELGEGRLGLVRDAAVVIEDGRVAWVGPQAELPEGAGAERIDAAGACVIPGFVDAHTHLVFGGDRVAEFAARMAGRPYAAGGIRTT
ncbi:MAG: amidohydrolase family protein, partial [Euzebyales bacterium]|nr:amidohydrolase family protein [Euzebyales bacterium]